MKKVLDKTKNISYTKQAVARENKNYTENYLVSRAIWRSTQAGRRGSPGKGVGR